MRPSPINSCHLTINFCQRNYPSDLCVLTIRPAERASPATTAEQEGTGIMMKKFGFATIVASGMAAAVLGLAGPAQADSSHLSWVDQLGSHVSVPQVDNTVHQSR
jgi:hypothetical protein